MTDIREILDRAERDMAEAFAAVDRNEALRARQVLGAFRKHGVSYRHFAPTTGYGYGDIGRDTLESVFAELFHAEAAVVRPHIASGTAALALVLSALTKSGDRILSATGMPYDTLKTVLGIGRESVPGSLRERGVAFDCVELKDGVIDIEAVDRALTDRTALVIAQRSRGYSLRPALMPEAFGALADMIHARRQSLMLMVDNCYGEFVCGDEPTDYGADVCVGSLIKNPGGGIAPTGGYVVGKSEAVERVAARLTAPGLGREIGSYAGSYRPYYQGLFMAPHTVAQALKTALLAARAAEMLGIRAVPASSEKRADVVQVLCMDGQEKLIRFCEGIQAASPVDSMAIPEPSPMPGYDDKVIMAAGTFVAGASIELSADAPLRPPFAVYLQGALTYAHGRLAMEEAFGRLGIK